VSSSSADEGHFRGGDGQELHVGVQGQARHASERLADGRNGTAGSSSPPVLGAEQRGDPLEIIHGPGYLQDHEHVGVLDRAKLEHL
jgi:hypothetical protein